MKVKNIGNEKEFNLILNKESIVELLGYRAEEIKLEEVYLPSSFNEYLEMFEDVNKYRKIDIMLATALMLKDNILRDKIQNSKRKNNFLVQTLFNFEMFNFTIDLSDVNFIYANFTKILKEAGLKERYTQKETFLKECKIFGSKFDRLEFFNNSIFLDIKSTNNVAVKIIKELELIENKTGISLQKAIKEVKKINKMKRVSLKAKRKLSDFFSWEFSNTKGLELNKKINEIYK